MKKIQFSIEAYTSGKYDVVTRDGQSVDIICLNGRGEFPVLGYVGDSEIAEYFTIKGCWVDVLQDSLDLFLVEKITYTDMWVNQYESYLDTSYSDIESCKTNGVSGYISTHKLRLHSNGKLEILETIYAENK